MRILLTNDDGIDAPGIKELKSFLAQEFQVFLVAPKEEKSACGHAITVHYPLRIQERGEGEWSVDGTPADCVKLGIHRLINPPPQLVISGINKGANVGHDLFYSGTVSAAIEGAIMGYPSLAFSLVEGEEWDFSFASHFALKYIKALVKEDLLHPPLLLNINVPSGKEEEIKGISYVKMGKTEYTDIFHLRQDPRNNPYYWMGGQQITLGNEEKTDVSMIKKGYISITPLHLDLTDYSFLKGILPFNK